MNDTRVYTYDTDGRMAFVDSRGDGDLYEDAQGGLQPRPSRAPPDLRRAGTTITPERDLDFTYENIGRISRIRRLERDGATDILYSYDSVVRS